MDNTSHCIGMQLPQCICRSINEQKWWTFQLVYFFSSPNVCCLQWCSSLMLIASQHCAEPEATQLNEGKAKPQHIIADKGFML